MLEIEQSLHSKISLCKMPLSGLACLLKPNLADLFRNYLLELMLDLLHKAVVAISVLIFLALQQLLKGEEALVDLLATALVLLKESIGGEMRGLELLDYSFDFGSKERAHCELMLVPIMQKITDFLINLKLLLGRSEELVAGCSRFIGFMAAVVGLDMQMPLEALVVEINAAELRNFIDR